MKAMSIFWARKASSSAMIWALVLRRGRRPKVTMMSQNSHWNGTAARELHAAEQVVLHLEQVETRRRHLGHVGLLGLFVARLMAALFPFAQEARPGFLRLADEDDVGQLAEVIFLDRDPRAADDREHVALFQLGQNLVHPPPLHAHAGQADDVGPGEAVEVDRLDIFVDERDGMLGRRQGRQQRQSRPPADWPVCRPGAGRAPCPSTTPRSAGLMRTMSAMTAAPG